MASFTFDALSRNRTRVVGGSTTDTYGYLGPSETVYEVATSGGSSRTIDAALGPDGARLALKDAGSFGWTLFDLHGDLAALENAGMTAVTDALRYDGYGATIDADGSFGSPWKFQGALDVAPNGEPLYDLGARLYAPSLGAFTSLDSIMGNAADPLSMNRFLYAEANPATLIDPTGHYAQVGEDICASCTPENKLAQTPAKQTHYKQVIDPRRSGHSFTGCGRLGECAADQRASGGARPPSAIVAHTARDDAFANPVGDPGGTFDPGLFVRRGMGLFLPGASGGLFATDPTFAGAAGGAIVSDAADLGNTVLCGMNPLCAGQMVAGMAGSAIGAGQTLVADPAGSVVAIPGGVADAGRDAVRRLGSTNSTEAGTAWGHVEFAAVTAVALGPELKGATTLGELGGVTGEVGGAGRIVIGRDMLGRVIPYAERTGAEFYGGTPRGLRWLPQRTQVWLNKRWLASKLREGFDIEDVGTPTTGLPPSPYYDGEHEVLSKFGYPRYMRIDLGD